MWVHDHSAVLHAAGFISYISLNPNWSVRPARLHRLCFDVAWCYSSWLKGAAESTVGKLDHRISMLTGLNAKHPHGEYLQVVNYGIGGHYEPHFDHATVSWLCKLVWWFSWLKLCWHQRLIHPSFQSPSSPVYKLKTGNRIATFMIYVSLDVTMARPPLAAEIAARFLFLFFSKALIKNTKGKQFLRSHKDLVSDHTKRKESSH